MPEDMEVDLGYDLEAGEILIDFSGRDLMLSSLREKCSHIVVKEKIAEWIEELTPIILMMEVDLFNSFVNRTRLCETSFQAEQRWTEVCLLTEDKVQKNIRMEVDRCVQDSFEIRGDLESDNRLLAEDMAWAQEHNIDYHPTITINN